ncbi:hypothetical protein [uncultured Alistipes sp.]|uniref:hypothetical protein n=1 Tax=uncultured Alistipes sp. TaxID=538949 RepID=UPI002624C4BC|nr:hypothetical protein [uncultured Alistipes sp.]
MTGLLMLAFAAAGCVKDDYGFAPSVVEGRPVTVTLKCDLGRTSDITVTRAGDHSYSHLSTLTLFVYDAEGKICQQALTLESGGGLTLLGDDTGPNGEWLYQLTFKTTSGEKKLLGVANYATGNSGFWSGFTSLKNQAAAGTLSFDALRQSLISLRDGLIGADGLIMPSITASSQMLISGWNEGVVFDANGVVTSFGTNGDVNKTIVLKMDRAMARIIFKIPSVSTVNSAGHTVTFVPSTYRVYNVPKKTLLVKQSLDASGAGSYAVDYLADEEFLTSATANVPAVSGGSYTFTFYMPENVQAEVAKNADGGNMSYVDREKWTGDPGSLPQNKTWTNAPEHSTFVVIGGTYTETNGTTPIYTGNVNYTVHLGDFSTGEGATGSYGNFSVERNYSYTYNMKVTGVENIKVEATVNGDERQPGAEGSIYDAQTCVYNYLVDAHFEQGYMQYDLSAVAGAVNADLATVTPDDKEIDDAISSKLFLEVQSPFMPQASHRGSLQPYKTYADAAARRVSMTPEEAKQNAVKDFDYKWVEFWPQNTTVISAYPGTPTWSHAYIEAYKPAETEAEKASYLLDAYDLIVAMGKVVKKIYLNQYRGGENTISTGERAESGITITFDQGKYYARFTAFVNEFYYYKNPLTGAALTSWGPLVNKSAREMIVAMSTNVSADGNSSYSQIHSYISQLSMQSFYNPNAGINAFGLETYNETPLTMGFTTSVSSLDDSDGRTNQVRLLSGNNSATSVPSDVPWDKYISTADNGWFSTIPSERANRKLWNAYKYSNAAYACLSRNRDLNGNGKIDDNEVRWYLASLNEYIRIGIGTNVLSNSAQLYMGDKMAMTHASYPKDYISDGALYFTSSADGKRVFWAVERGAYGRNDSSYKLPIRCIRVLPDGKTKKLTEVSGVVAASTVEKRTDKSSHLTVLKFKGRVVDELYRQRVDDALDKHNEDDDANAYYDGIYVADDIIRRSGSSTPLYYMLGDIIGYEGTVPIASRPYTHTFDGTMINPCREKYGAGWRVPSLVELSAMNAFGLLTNDHEEACCTQFSNLGVRFGFARSSLIYCPGGNGSNSNPNYSELANSSKFVIRCVKDVEADYDFDTQSDPD